MRNSGCSCNAQKYNYANNYGVSNSYNYQNRNNQNGYYDERGFFIPFAIGGLAGTALGYGIANNNMNYYPYPVYYGRPMPYGPYYY